MADAFYTAGNFTARRSIGYLIRRAFKLMHPRAEAVFDDTDFTLSQWITLKLLSDGVVSTCAEVARNLSHTTGATTRLIDQLEERGLLNRVRSAEDRRLVTLELTEAGRATVDEMHPRMMNLWNGFLQDFEADEVETLIGLLQRLVAGIEKRTEP